MKVENIFLENEFKKKKLLFYSANEIMFVIEITTYFLNCLLCGEWNLWQALMVTLINKNHDIFFFSNMIRYDHIMNTVYLQLKLMNL